MNLRVSLYYGLRNFVGRKRADERRRSHLLLPIVSIALSLIPVIVILTVANGMIEGITQRYIEFDTGHLRMTLSGGGYDVDVVKKRLPELKKAPGIVYASLEIRGGGLLFAGGKRSFVNIRAVDPGLDRDDPGFARFTKITRGAFDLSRKNSIVIGKALAEEYGLTVGQTVTVFTHRTKRVGRETVIQARPNRYTITGIYSIGYQELDKSTVFIQFAAGERDLSSENSYIQLKLKVADPFTHIDRQASHWERFIDPDAVYWRLLTWREMYGNYYQAYESTKVLLLFIMLLIVVVAAFNIISSMIMMYLDRLQEIGILKSLGASPGSITFSFLCVGLLAGLFSTAIGVGAGLLVAVNINEIFKGIDVVMTAGNRIASLIASPFTGPFPVEQVQVLNPEYYLEVIPIRIGFWEVLGVSLFTVGLAVFFSIFPAFIAGRIRPLEVIRKH
ncbi:MAG: ABC transporter permease [Spirochaetales bacterium]|nr:ABC transporter permease [Spirochaetales bacterium]